MAAVAAAEAVMKFPEIKTSGIYQGKYRDRNPDIRSAGKLTATGISAADSLKPAKRPVSPDVIRRFRATFRPDEGRQTVFYGQARDPQRVWAKEMVHGILSQPHTSAWPLLNPPPKTRFRQVMLDQLDSGYAHVQRAPLSKSHDQRPGLPADHNPLYTTYGIVSGKHDSAGELINPNKERGQVNEEAEVGRDMYRKTHFDFLAGERHNRAYVNFNSDEKFGIPTPHANDGRHVKNTMFWLHERQIDKTTPLVAKRVDDFRERTQPVLGKTLDPIKDTLNVPEDHTFGILLKPDEYGVGDLIHSRPPSEYLRGKDRMRGLVAALRQLLKKGNYHNFPDLLAAFQFYDKNCSGKIDINELREVCTQFSLPAEPVLLEQLMDYCDANKDGLISYVEFANFLNWKDKLPSGLPPKGYSLPDNEIVKNAELTRKGIHDQDSTAVTLQAQIDAAVGQHRTSANMINAVVGGISTRGYRTFGIPTVRTDLAAPKFRRIDDRINYGDVSDGGGLVNPNIYSNAGVYEIDFFKARPRDELLEIFQKIGVEMTLETFDAIYRIAASEHPAGNVSVESFRCMLDETQAFNLQDKKVVP